MQRATPSRRRPLLIYRLDLHLAGGLEGCLEHLPRIASMGFDHVMVDGEDTLDASAARRFCEAVGTHGMRAVTGLDLRRTGSEADVGFHCSRLREDGWQGVRVLAATAWSPGQWEPVLRELHDGESPMLCIADGLGAPASDGLALAIAGFDAIIDSGAWWDGRASWYHEQRNALARFCRPLTFVEDATIGRLRERLPAAALSGLRTAYATEHAWALCRSHGVIAPMGFEHASELPLGDPSLGPGDWARSVARAEIDLQPVLADIHEGLAGHPAFDSPGRIAPLPVRTNAAAEGPLAIYRSIGAPSSPALIALRRAPGAPPDETVEVDVQGAAFASDTGLHTASECTPAGLRDTTAPPAPSSIADASVGLGPGELRLFGLQPDAGRPKAPPRRALLRRLDELASRRIAIESVTPCLDGGRFAVKRVIGDTLVVQADVFCDGHDKVRPALRIRHASQAKPTEVAMQPLGNDRWQARVPLTRIGRYDYTVVAWRAPVATWLEDARKKRAAGQALTLELRELARLLAEAHAPALVSERARIDEVVAALEPSDGDDAARIDEVLDGPTADWLERLDVRESETVHDVDFPLVVDRARGRFGAWYEIFPRSASDDMQRHGTFDDVIARLPYIESMGFDVLYFPPIHPIGRKNRKGRNNALRAEPGEPGSPYAIGGEEGGHDAIHPELGTLKDFRRLVDAAADHGMEIALDFAIQCSPDHPWLREHPEWFEWRPDGSLRYAENPPKKYEDITNVSFYTEAAMPDLWLALREIVRFWIGHGVRIFRVDNPHTKPYPFWAWLIESVQAEHPGAIFLSEAFTRPKVMARLAKVGFTQSYTYFTWRDTKDELTEYLTELSSAPLVDAMRPNFFVNTPDINPLYLQESGRAGFIVRATLAATLSPSWGMLAGYELCEFEPLPGREEYLDSEKYQLRARDWDAPGNIRAEITRLNQIRRLNPALWQLRNIEFHLADNPRVIAYSKWTDGLDNLVFVIVNLDPHGAQACEFEIPLWRFGLADHAGARVADLIEGHEFAWQGKRQFIHLDPDRNPVGIWRLSPGTGARPAIPGDGR